MQARIQLQRLRHNGISPGSLPTNSPSSPQPQEAEYLRIGSVRFSGGVPVASGTRHSAELIDISILLRRSKFTKCQAALHILVEQQNFLRHHQPDPYSPRSAKIRKQSKIERVHHQQLVACKCCQNGLPGSRSTTSHQRNRSSEISPQEIEFEPEASRCRRKVYTAKLRGAAFQSLAGLLLAVALGAQQAPLTGDTYENVPRSLSSSSEQNSPLNEKNNKQILIFLLPP
jgi:hypothetical protein